MTWTAAIFVALPIVYILSPFGMTQVHAFQQQSFIQAATCLPGSAPFQEWQFNHNTLQVVSGLGLCLTSSKFPPTDGTALVLQPCEQTAPASQQFTFKNDTSPGDNAISLTLAQAPSFCVNLQDYGKSSGTQVWLYTCSPSDCIGNCAWNQQAVNTSGFGKVQNAGSDLCLDTGKEHVCMRWYLHQRQWVW